MSTFFDKFPKIPYDIAKIAHQTNYESITNILFRFSIIKQVLDNTSSYYVYEIRDGERPETLADKIYNNPEAYWIILYANDMIDPQYDWPLNYRDFGNYIVNKYGSIANAQVGIHHYEKVVTREELASGTITINTHQIDYNAKSDSVITLNDITGTYLDGEAVFQGSNLSYSSFSANVISFYSSNGYMRMANTLGQIARYSTLTGDNSSATGTIQTLVYPEAPYDYYLNLPETADASLETLNVNGKYVEQVVSRRAITYYDYEDELNFRKRLIKVIKPEYYTQIMSEFLSLVDQNDSFFLRKIS